MRQADACAFQGIDQGFAAIGGDLTAIDGEVTFLKICCHGFPCQQLSLR
jgi:hypothetical protein